jgi:aspartate/glutamate racemase
MTSVRVGLLHTVPALAGTFTTLVQPQLPDASLVHVVDAELLATAMREGVTPSVYARVAAHIAYLAASGCRAVLVTCSSIGEAVDAAARTIDIPVIRTDAPMAGEAVRLASATSSQGPGIIVVLATLDATLDPSVRLIESRAGAVDVTVHSRVVPGAAEARANGDLETHDGLIADAVVEAAITADVIVLAQASMADAAGKVSTRVPVLSSPSGGVAALVAAVAD